MCAHVQSIRGSVNIRVIITIQCQVLRQLSNKQLIIKQLLLTSAMLGPIKMRKRWFLLFRSPPVVREVPLYGDKHPRELQEFSQAC